jgi:hypothetical protein
MVSFRQNTLYSRRNMGINWPNHAPLTPIDGQLAARKGRETSEKGTNGSFVGRNIVTIIAVQIFIIRGGGKSGPFSLDQIREQLAEGNL